jgi:ABC-type polysaccharide/polyol phosphate export permease
LVVLTMIFFSLSWAFASLCERVRDTGPDTF